MNFKKSIEIGFRANTAATRAPSRRPSVASCFINGRWALPRWAGWAATANQTSNNPSLTKQHEREVYVLLLFLVRCFPGQDHAIQERILVYWQRRGIAHDYNRRTSLELIDIVATLRDLDAQFLYNCSMQKRWVEGLS